MLTAFPEIVRLGGHRSVYGIVRRYLRDDSLRRVFSLQPLLVGGHPFHTSGLYALIQHLERMHGVWFPQGGTGALVAGLAALMRRQGITIRLQADVDRLLHENGRIKGVALATGETLRAEAVIANADAPAIYADLLPGVKRRRWTDRKLDRLDYSMGLFVFYFGTNRRYEATAHHTILLGQKYKELLDEIFGRGTEAPDDLSLYLHRPTATDPGMAPPGCDAFYVLAPVPNLRAGIDWAVAGPKLRDRLVAMMETRELPGLAAAIVTESWMTPETFRQDYRSRHGAGFSVSPRLTQSAWFRFHNKSEEVGGLYLVGAGTHPGAGLPGVLTSAKVVETLLKEDNK
jgi:phytoene desaturase